MMLVNLQQKEHVHDNIMYEHIGARGGGATYIHSPHHFSPLAAVHNPYQRLVRERVGLYPRLAHLAEQCGGLPPPLPALEGHEHGVVVERVGVYALVLARIEAKSRPREGSKRRGKKTPGDKG